VKAEGERSIHLEVVTPERKIVSESVDEVVLPGSQGYLGVLPGHAPLLTDLGIGTVSYRRGSETRYLSLAWGFAEVLPNRVSILAEIAERAEEIDRERAEKARDRAIGRLKGRGDDIDFKRAQVALEKSLIRIQVASQAGPHGPA
jgi:F-type H+-transporting ATPase subunit epsilon